MTQRDNIKKGWKRAGFFREDFSDGKLSEELSLIGKSFMIVHNDIHMIHFKYLLSQSEIVQHENKAS